MNWKFWKLALLTAAVCAFTDVASAQSYTIFPSPPPGPPVPLATGFAGKSYSGAFLSTNGNGPTTWSISAGSLPPGLSINTIPNISATITGTPTTLGTFPFTVRAQELSGLTATQQYTIDVIPPLTITTPATLHDATAGAGYSQTFSAINGTPPYFWLEPGSGSLRKGAQRRFVTVRPRGLIPSGMFLNSTGVLTGSPTQTGSYTFDVEVDDDSGTAPQYDIKTFTLTVNPGPSITSPTTLPAATLGTAYKNSLTGKDGSPPYLWFLSGGSLPPGIKMDTSGTLAGTPTVSGDYLFIVTLSDSNNARTNATLALSVTDVFGITTPSPLPNGSVGVAYPRQQLTGSGGKTPYIWQVVSGTLPTGLTLNRSTGLLTGTPAATGDFQFTVQLTDATPQSLSKPFTLTITAALAIGTTSLPDGNIGAAYSQSIVATGGTLPYVFALTGALPPGLALNQATGAITGTPIRIGLSSFSARVTDAAGATVTQPLSINITNTPPLAFSTASPLPSVPLGTVYAQSVTVTGGTTPYVFAIDSGSPPAGITLANGTLAGTPAAAGTFQFTIRVTDAQQSTLTKLYALTVTTPPLPDPTITGVGNTAPPAQQPDVALNIANPYPVRLDGTITLAFDPATGNPDDPAIQFSTGGRTAGFTIPAGATDAVFPNTQLALSTGTVAGKITLALHFQAGGVDVTPDPEPRVIDIPAQAPVISKVTARRTGSGIEVEVTGFSNTRDMTSATFQFQASAGTSLTTSSVTIQTGPLFTPWYSDSNSISYGSLFTFTQQFSISGNAAGVTGVSVTLTNPQGTSSAVSATVQ